MNTQGKLVPWPCDRASCRTPDTPKDIMLTVFFV